MPSQCVRRHESRTCVQRHEFRHCALCIIISECHHRMCDIMSAVSVCVCVCVLDKKGSRADASRALVIVQTAVYLTMIV